MKLKLNSEAETAVPSKSYAAVVATLSKIKVVKNTSVEVHRSTSFFVSPNEENKDKVVIARDMRDMRDLILFRNIKSSKIVTKD